MSYDAGVAYAVMQASRDRLAEQLKEAKNGLEVGDQVVIAADRDERTMLDGLQLEVVGIQLQAVVTARTKDGRFIDLPPDEFVVFRKGG